MEQFLFKSEDEWLRSIAYSAVKETTQISNNWESSKSCGIVHCPLFKVVWLSLGLANSASTSSRLIVKVSILCGPQMCYKYSKVAVSRETIPQPLLWSKEAAELQSRAR